MLDHRKLLDQIEKASNSLFFDNSHELTVANQIWNQILQDPTFDKSIRLLNSQWVLPTWHGELNNVVELKSETTYNVLSIDGSQIYPDKHHGLSCYLINVGSTIFSYGSNSRVELNSTPFLFTFEQNQEHQESVDCKRQELELQATLDVLEQDNQIDLDMVIFDGSLIFWHLEAKSIAIQREYLEKYLNILDKFYKKGLTVASYISYPKSKELINLIRAQLKKLNQSTNLVDNLIDTDILNFFLRENNITTVFQNHSQTSKKYPNHLHPHFFYINVGKEIARVEIPAYIAKDEKIITKIGSIILDQCIKGHGYPIGLAEAHEQAVVKSRDKELFFHLVQKLGINRKSFTASQKMLKKRFSSI